MENCDGHGGGVRGLWEVQQLSRNVTVIREVWKVLERSVRFMEKCCFFFCFFFLFGSKGSA